MATMTSRERVLRTVNFQEADRVPIDLGAMKASGITVRAYNQLKATLGIHTPTRIWDPRLMIACVEEEVMRRFHADVVPLDVTAAVHDVRPDSEWDPENPLRRRRGPSAAGTPSCRMTRRALDPAGLGPEPDDFPHAAPAVTTSTMWPSIRARRDDRSGRVPAGDRIPR